MLSWRTPFWLFIFCICAAVMTYFTVNYFPQGDVRSVRSSLLPYNRLDASEIIIRHIDKEQEIKCIKKNGVWYLDDGYLVRANSDRISLLLNALVGDSIRERITKRQRERRELSLNDFGLENYKTELIIKSGKEEVSITIGVEAPYENTVFVKSNTSSEVYIVDGVLCDILPLNIDEFRDRTLFPYPISLINKLEVIGEKDNSFVIEKDSIIDGWLMTSPVRAPASKAVDSLLQSLSMASINNFVWHPVGNIVSQRTILDNVSPYGLDPIEAQTTVRAWIDGIADPIEIRIGRPLKNDIGLLYAFSSVDNSVFTLDQTTVAPFVMGYEAMRNHSIFTTPIYNISSVSYMNGDNLCLLTANSNEEWEIVIPSKQPTEPNAIINFLKALSQISDSEIVVDDVVLPTSSVELKFVDKNETVNQLNFYYDSATHPTNIYLTTSSSSFISRIAPDSLPIGFLDENFAASFRSTEIFKFEPIGVKEFSINRGNSSQSVYLTASGEWRTHDKSNGAVKSEVAEYIVNSLSNLKADWVSKLFITDVKAYGFAEPKVELQVVFSNDIVQPYGMPTVIIQLGEQLSTGGYYLRIKGEEELFVVSEEFAKALIEAKLY